MIPFSLKLPVYKMVQAILKFLVKMAPFPRPVLFQGPDSSLELCESLALLGHKKLLVVTDGVLVELGVIDGMLARLKENDVAYAVYDKITPDPSIAQIEGGLAMLKSEKCDGILAIGGGSPIDAAKMVAAMATNDKPIRKFEGLFKVWKPILPLYAVPTTAGTGSEVTVAAVVSDPENKKKSACTDPKLVPHMACLDGKLMTGIPPHITAATGMDALTHAVEAYISRNALDDTDTFALAATRLIMEYLPVAVKDGQNLDARQKMAQASHFAALAFTRAGVGYVHAIAHQIGAHYHVPHGLANAIIMPYVLDYSKPECTSRLADLGRAAGVEGSNDNELADAFIARIRQMNEDFGIPDKLEKLDKADIPAIRKAALKEAHWTYAVPRYMDPDTCEDFVAQMGT